MALSDGITLLPGSTINAGRLNMIINGNMDVWQRGGTFVSVSSGDVTADQWQWGQAGGATGVVDVVRSSSAPGGSQHSLSMTAATADSSIAASDYYVMLNRIEGKNTRSAKFGTSDAEDVTLSFWVRSAVTGIHSVGVRNDGATRAYVAEYTINVADTWEYKTITIPGDTSGTWLTGTDIGIEVLFPMAIGSTFSTTPGSWVSGNFFGSTNQVNVMATSSNAFHLAQVQIEVGSEASEFEYRQFGEELALCKRYYQEGDDASRIFFNGDVTSGATYRTILRFPVEFRAAPTVVFSNESAFHFPSGVPSQDAIDMNSIRVSKVASATQASGYYFYDWTASAEL